MTRALIVLALSVTVGCVTRVPRTEVIVEIDAESSVIHDTTSVHVAVLGGPRDGTLSPQADQDLGGTIPWPVMVALAPAGNDTDRVFLVEGTATDASGATLGIVRARSSYIAGRTLTLRLTLEDCCRTVAAMCAADQTCRSCTCVSAEVPPSSLPDWRADAGLDPNHDAGLSDAADAGAPDTGGLDAASDAGADAPVPDAAEPDTSCVGTRCYHLVRTPMTWPAARSACMSMGAELVSIYGALEQANVWAVASGLQVWTGGMNSGTSTWSWTDGSTWSSQWAPGEPNLPLAVYAYVNLIPGYGGAWGDDQSSVTLPFICEYAL